LILEYLSILKSMPLEDHISINYKLRFVGILKKLKDIFDNFRFQK